MNSTDPEFILLKPSPARFFWINFIFNTILFHIIQKIHSKVGSKIKAKHQTWKKFSSEHKNLWCLNHWSLLTPKVCRCDGRQWKHVSREQWGHSKVFKTFFSKYQWNPRPEDYQLKSTTRDQNMVTAVKRWISYEVGDGSSVGAVVFRWWTADLFLRTMIVEKNTLAFSALTILHWLINSFRWQRSTQIAGIPQSPSGSLPKYIFQNKSRSSPSGWLW